jgi:hypothetical protein
MPQVAETNGLPPNQLYGALLAGLDDISQQTKVTFATYTKVVLPLVGFVFWLRTGGFEATGALHWTSDRRQEEDETYAQNSVAFTTTTEITELNNVATNILAVGEIEGLRYAFQSHGWFFPQAGLWHFLGDAISPSQQTQFIEDPNQLDPTKLIVSDSLPVWLTLVNYTPPWLAPLNPGITLYPSFLSPDNQPAPFGTVHIEPSSIRALQAAPSFDARTTHSQLTAERVRVTLHGVNNDGACDFLDLVERFSFDTDAIGLMNMPTVRDEKRPWAEGMILGQTKTIEFEVSYIQSRVNAIARQMVLDAVAVVTPIEFVLSVDFTGDFSGDFA